MSLCASKLVQAACGSRVAVRTMYKNPYIARFKQRSKVSPDFYKKILEKERKREIVPYSGRQARIADHRQKYSTVVVCEGNCICRTTGLTGLFVNEHPHRTLSVVYCRILKALEQIPPTAAYRKYTEAIVKQRLALVQAEDNIPALEEKIGMGQIEEVIEQAEYELEATRAIIESRAWEPLVEEAPKGQWDWPIV
ncbi:hypothetical protein Y032_0037g3446 [Ancylostoma ceylanicum]|uniref:ETC complex I subunit region n=1 Tax=Ancylostoma ceylanicum TaxID=53326 RepID=A0A016UIV1_9BILA|nr:hypothetical protein Y032_0037g3446 [Ancylostoma ceylanicum]